MSTQNATPTQVPETVTEKTIVDSVLKKINKFQENTELTLPADYYPENALKSAYLLLIKTTNSNDQPVLTCCTPDSIAHALLEMVVKGLTPMKKQCYFIAYGNQLTLSISYQGNVAMAKRVGLKMVTSNVIFKNDTFEHKIEPSTGLMKILEHKQHFSNINIDEIDGAYAVTTMDNGTNNLTIMTMAQIRQAWMQGYMNGNSGAHNNFTDEMCRKTVINRACKHIVNSSTDIILTLGESKRHLETPEPKQPEQKQPQQSSSEIPETKQIGFNDEQNPLDEFNKQKAEPTELNNSTTEKEAEVVPTPDF